MPNKLNRRQYIIKKIVSDKFLYVLMLPGLLYFLLFRYLPLLGTLVAFKDVAPFDDVLTILTSEWVGLKHFSAFISSHYFWNIMRNTFTLAGLRMLFEFFCPILLALLINEVRNKHYKKVIQTISYMPYFLSNIVLAGLVFQLLTMNNGIIPSLVEYFGGDSIYYLGDARYFRTVLVSAIVWRNIGWGTIVYLAALSGVDPQLYEAARIDGASRFAQTVHITLPSISFAVVIMFILRISVILNQGWEETLLLYNPGVYSVADIIDTYVWRVGLEQMRYSFATAVGVFKSLLALVLVLTSNYVAKKNGQQSMYK
ncbi:MAG: ABC transporter permease subunit [Spirochaetaceae bacterium]